MQFVAVTNGEADLGPILPNIVQGLFGYPALNLVLTEPPVVPDSKARNSARLNQLVRREWVDSQKVGNFHYRQDFMSTFHCHGALSLLKIGMLSLCMGATAVPRSAHSYL
jgi:hypothetical protein